jgi:WXG100 family type VII secretion target
MLRRDGAALDVLRSQLHSYDGERWRVTLSGAFGTTTDDMAKAAQQVLQVSESLQQQMRSLMNNLEPLAGSWKGQAASAFQQLMERFNTDSQKLSTALGNIATALDANTKNYNSSEETNHSAISNILGGLS